MSETPSDPIQLRDEILQFLFWMRGEGLAERLTLDRLSNFLRQSPERTAEAVSALLESGFLGAAGDGSERQFYLSTHGIREGGRRFQEEFEPYLGHETHLVCDDPHCECHSPDWEGVCRHLESDVRGK